MCTKWVSHFLIKGQRWKLVDVVTAMLVRMGSEHDFLKRVITIDETWMYHFYHCIKLEFTMYRKKGAPKKQKVQQQKSVGKLTCITFFDNQWIIYQHKMQTTKPRMTVNAGYCVKVLKLMCQHVNLKRPEMAKSFILHQENAPPYLRSHNAVLEENEGRGPRTLPYSSNIAPFDFCLFPVLKCSFRGK